MKAVTVVISCLEGTSKHGTPHGWYLVPLSFLQYLLAPPKLQTEVEESDWYHSTNVTTPRSQYLKVHFTSSLQQSWEVASWPPISCTGMIGPQCIIWLGVGHTQAYSYQELYINQAQESIVNLQ